MFYDEKKNKAKGPKVNVLSVKQIKIG